MSLDGIDSFVQAASDSKTSKGPVASKGSKSPHAAKSGKGSKVIGSKVIEIIVSNGRFDAPYYTFTVGGSPIDIASYEFIRGQTYKFVYTGDSTHPFFINNASSFPITSTGTPTTGIYGGNSLQFQIPLNYQLQYPLYYYCVNPSHNMIGELKIQK
jgi:hypothetical protein